MIRWLVTGVGCVAIWPATVPKLALHRPREVAMLALPAEFSHNPAKKGLKIVVGEGRLGMVQWE